MTSLKSKPDHLPDHCRSLILLSWHAILLATTILAAPATARQAQDDSPRELSGMSASMSFNTKDDLPLDPQSETAVSMCTAFKRHRQRPWIGLLPTAAILAWPKPVRKRSTTVFGCFDFQPSCTKSNASPSLTLRKHPIRSSSFIAAVPRQPTHLATLFLARS